MRSSCLEQPKLWDIVGMGMRLGMLWLLGLSPAQPSPQSGVAERGAKAVQKERLDKNKAKEAFTTTYANR